jgi:hypothetical protein
MLVQSWSNITPILANFSLPLGENGAKHAEKPVSGNGAVSGTFEKREERERERERSAEREIGEWSGERKSNKFRAGLRGVQSVPLHRAPLFKGAP